MEGRRGGHIMVTLPPDMFHHSNLPEEIGELKERKDGVGQGTELQPLDQRAQGGGLLRMKALYNLEEGRVGCRCILRRWKFCQHIKGQADGAKLNSKLLQTHTLKEVQTMEKNNHRQGGGPGHPQRSPRPGRGKRGRGCANCLE